jgi:membrane protease YdiL (CAAX protease family)
MRSQRSQTRWWPYFALVFAVSWTGWIAAAATGRQWTGMPVVLLFVLGGSGPLVAALILTRTSLDRDARRRFWLRVVDPRGVTPSWYLLILVLGVAPALLAVLLRGLWDGGWETAPAQWPALSALVGILLFNLIASLAEEPGWRGCALDRLMERVSGRAAALAIGCVWLLWHVPLYFVEGTFQQGHGIFSLGFFGYSLALLPSAVLLGWVVVKTGGSILAAVLLHLVENVSGEVLEIDPATQAIRVVVLVIVAAAVWRSWRPEDAGPTPGVPDPSSEDAAVSRRRPAGASSPQGAPTRRTARR